MSTISDQSNQANVSGKTMADSWIMKVLILLYSAEFLARARRHLLLTYALGRVGG